MGLSEAQKRNRSEYLEKNLDVTECSQHRPYVFISYASDDWETVFKSAVVPMQKEYGLRVYADKAFDKVNDKWIVPMLRNVRGADMIVAFISQSYIESYACFLELLTAVNNRKQIVFVTLGEQLCLGDTTDLPMIERGAKNEILNQGANISTNTNNTSNDLMRAMKSAYTSLSTLLEQDALSKYDISDAFINFFRDASVSRKTIHDLGAVRRTIKSVSRNVFDKEKAAEAGRQAAPAQTPEASPVQAEQPEPVQTPEHTIQATAPEQTAQTPSVQAKQAGTRQPDPKADFLLSENERRSKKPLNKKFIGGGIVAAAAIIFIAVFAVLGGTKNVTDMPYTTRTEKSGLYTGEWKKDQPEGYGTFIFDDTGNVYEGEWKDGARNGQGTWTSSEGNIYEGEWKDDHSTEGTLTYANGDVYKGEWSSGYKHGKGTMTYANGNTYEGQWSNGMRNGEGTMTYADGSIREGIWRNSNLESGHATYTNDDGNNYDGEVKGTPSGSVTPDGQGTMKYSNGNIYEGAWSSGKRNGQGTLTYADGSIFTGEWKDGSLETGHAKYTTESGSSYDGGARSNEDGGYTPNGQGTMTYTNGSVYTGEWKDGIMETGHAKFTTENGDSYDGEVTYVGTYDGEKRYSPNGRGTAAYANGDVYEGELADGKRAGQGTMKYSNGLVYEGEWTNDRRNGQGTLTYTDGSVYEGEFADGEKNGEGTYTKKDGTVVKEQWDHGTKLE